MNSDGKKIDGRIRFLLSQDLRIKQTQMLTVAA